MAAFKFIQAVDKEGEFVFLVIGIRFGHECIETLLKLFLLDMYLFPVRRCFPVARK